jgi:hypothetical protein
MAASDNLNNNEFQFHVKMTPKQHDALGAYLGDSDYLNSAQDAGMRIDNEKRTVHLPNSAVTHFGHFVNMRKEIAEDNRSSGDADEYDRAFEGLHKKVSSALGTYMPKKFS